MYSGRPAVDDVRPQEREPEDGKDDEHDAVADESAAQGRSLLASVRMATDRSPVRRPSAAPADAASIGGRQAAQQTARRGRRTSIAPASIRPVVPMVTARARFGADGAG